MRVRYKKYTKEELEPIVKKCESWKQVCLLINIKPASGSQTNLSKRAKILGIDSTHFKGKCWNKGKRFPPKNALEKYLNNEIGIKSHSLKLRLIREGIKEKKCELCGLCEWQNNIIPLELDHINSNHFDNRIENLQILCPNCHALETKNRCIKLKIPIKIRKKKKDVDPNWRTNPKPNQRKVDRPSKNVLIDLIEKLSFVKIGKQFGVSDNAVRKWCKWYGIRLNARVLELVDNSVLEADAK